MAASRIRRGLRLLTDLLPAALLATLTTALPAQEPTRPRIGLVLSGGGARGAAHIGVLQVLEDLRIPVDCIAGTSMGSIVGGLYAAGYSPREIEEIVTGADWGALLSDAPPRQDLWFRRRQDRRRFQVDLEFGLVDGALALPPGLILGRNIEEYLERLLLSVATTSDFDDLQLPFRCVATDLADGSAVVMDRGNVARAIRASMSLPGVFAPVIRDGRALVDGGIVDNVPVDVARDLGADIVIAVDISTPLSDAERLGSLLSISDQVVGILMQENRRRSMDSLRTADFALVPELGDLSALQFDRSAEAVRIGRETADAQREALSRLTVDADVWQEWLAGQRMPAYEPPAIRNLTITGDVGLSDAVIRRFSALEEGAPLDPDALGRTRRQLAGLGIIDRVDVDVTPVEGTDREVDVELRPTEKAWGPHYFRFGLGMASDLKGNGDFDLGVQHTWTPLNSLGGEWRNEVQLGTRTRLLTEFYQPLDPGLRWFIQPNITYEQDSQPIIVNRQKVAQYSIEAFDFGFAAGRNLGSWGELSVRYGWLVGSATPDVAFPGTVPGRVDLETGRLTTKLTVDTLDRLAFPRAGLIGELTWELDDESLGSDGSSSVLEGLAGVPLSVGPVTIFPAFEAGSTLESDGGLTGGFYLGGFRRLSGLGPRELSGDHYALGVLQSYYQLSPRTTRFDFETYIGASLEVGGIWQDRDDFLERDFLVGGSVFVGVDSLIGPGYLGFGYTEGGDTALYVFVGPAF